MSNPKFLNRFENKVNQTLKRYKLCSKKEKIIVAASGGKDSTSVLYLLKKFGYHVEAMHLDLLIGEWSKQNSENLQKFCKENKIKLHLVNLRKELGASMCFIRSKVQKNSKISNCLVCGIIKRWLINKKARELGAKKLATGHNLDDEAETIIMNLLKGNLKLNLNLGPKTGIIQDKKFVPRIKPLYFCLNDNIKKYSQIKKFPVLYQPCPCRTESFRKKIRDLLNKTEKENPKIKMNIVKTFLKLLPALRKKYRIEEKLNYCKNCGEPSRQELCKMCRLLAA